MFFNVRDKSFIYLLSFPFFAVILGSLSFYIIDQRIDEPSIENMEDAVWLTITTMSTVGYGEIYPATTEGRAVATVLLFAGILTFFGFLTTIASKIIKPTLEVKSKDKPDDQKRYKIKSDLMNRNNDDNNSNNEHYDKDQIIEFLKYRIDNLDRLNKEEFTNLIIKIIDYYQNNHNKNRLG